jgi:hypothetical protein
MPKLGGAVALMRAGEKARRAAQRVTDAERALAKARKAYEKADAAYLALVRESIPQFAQGACPEGVGTPTV